MSKKTTKTKAKQSKGSQLSVPIGVIITLSVALVVSIAFAVCAIAQLKSPSNDLARAKLEVFDHLISEYMRNVEISSSKKSINEVTGYGVSDEDGVFYTTFDFATYDLDENNMPVFDDVEHGIIYFWKDAEHGTYSHAFSYHDDYYHPGGVYTEIGEHQLRNQLQQAK